VGCGVLGLGFEYEFEVLRFRFGVWGVGVWGFKSPEL